MNIIEEELQMETDQPSCHKRRRTLVERAADFWETEWGKLLRHPDVDNILTRIGKRFRRRFRLPVQLFEHLVTICRMHNIFSSVYKSRIPIEAKVLAC